MSTEAQKKACRNYYHRSKAIKKAIMLRLDKREDADVIEALERRPSKVGYIRQLVRADIARGGGDV